MHTRTDVMDFLKENVCILKDTFLFPELWVYSPAVQRRVFVGINNLRYTSERGLYVFCCKVLVLRNFLPNLMLPYDYDLVKEIIQRAVVLSPTVQQDCNNWLEAIPFQYLDSLDLGNLYQLVLHSPTRGSLWNLSA